MSHQLSYTSLLLLIFYLAWFSWEQRELIQIQKEDRLLLEQRLLYQNIIINAAFPNQQQDQYPLYQRKYD